MDCMMLAYHPALDPYHAGFRMLCIMFRSPMTSFAASQLRILDFYSVFPDFITLMTFPVELRAWRKRLTQVNNPYRAAGNKLIIFNQMQPAQTSGLKYLIANRSVALVDPHTPIVKLEKERVVSHIKERVMARIAASPDSTLLEFLAVHLAALPLNGKDGLKSRSTLMESKYDAT